MNKLPKYKRVFGDRRLEVQAAVAVRYELGESIREIAVSIGRSYGFVHRLLYDAGVEFRPRGGDRTKRTEEVTA